MKRVLEEEILLYFPSCSRPYVLYTDASKIAIGSALFPRDVQDELRLVALASRTLKGAEPKYFTSEQELLGIVWSLQNFRTYLLRAPVLIRTDHQALMCFQSSRFTSSRLTRWSLAIQDYSYNIEYIKGSVNIMADALSRIRFGHEDALTALILAREPDAPMPRGIT